LVELFKCLFVVLVAFILSCPDGLLLFDVKKKQKTPAENFCLKVCALAWTMRSQKFVRPDWSKTEMKWVGLVGWK